MVAELLWRALSRSAAATEAAGEALGHALVPGALLALSGELGSGKTTFVRGLGRGLELADEVCSPTFTRMRVLRGRLPLYHFDAWRAGSEALLAEGAEFLAGDGVAVVEWADRVAELLPEPRAELVFLHRGPDERELRARVIAPARATPGQREMYAVLVSALRQASTAAGLERL